MKALKLSAVIFTALAALSACKTAPGESSADAKLREGLNDALGQIGSVAGMTGYTQKLTGGEGELTHSMLTEIYFDNPAAPASFKEASSSIYNGTAEDGETFDNEIINKYTTVGGVKLLAKGTDFTSYKYQKPNPDAPPTDVPLVDTDVAGYIFIELTGPVNKEWEIPRFGGSGQWETDSGFGPQRYALKVDGNKLYFMSISISDMDKSVTFNVDPRSPSEQGIYTKK